MKRQLNVIVQDKDKKQKTSDHTIENTNNNKTIAHKYSK